jgi:phosphatidylglycerol---prolipoprotein diacylglyceryl transferase
VTLGAVLALLLLEIRYPWIDPVALPLPGPLDVRWYGLGYLIGFTAAYLILRKLAREGFLAVTEEAVGDLLFALILGLILGARIGYILFYDFASFAENPARIIRLWEGGLSFHGGAIGLVLAALWFARREGIRLLHLGDSMALAATPGIFMVRVANFINGELYGRVTGEHVPWAMRFPTDPDALRLLGADRLPMRERELAIGDAYRTGLWDQINHQVPLRHPSQLYEALAEGLLLGLILWAVYAFWKRRGGRPAHGILGGIFFIGYGAFRSFVELYRQPDAQFRSPDDPVGTVLGPLTMGQTLSLSMVLVGCLIIFLAWSSREAGAGPGRRPAGGARRAARRR